jgi:hypothetical protein
MRGGGRELGGDGQVTLVGVRRSLRHECVAVGVFWVLVKLLISFSSLISYVD